MHSSPARQRWRARARRRHQIRRRRAVALVVLVTLVALAVWAAYAIPRQTPARVPESAALPTFAQSPDTSTGVVVASVEGVEVLLPVAPEVTTAIAYHSVGQTGTVPFTPAGDRLGGGNLGQRLADIFAGGGGVRYYLMGADGGDESSSTAGLDIGAVPGSPVVSPVDGKVTGIKKYTLLGRFRDVELHISLSADPSLLLVVTHIAQAKVAIGDEVKRGTSVLGQVRGFPAALDQQLSRFTSDRGDHVQLLVLRVTPELAAL